MQIDICRLFKFRHSPFDIRHSFVIRHSSFVIYTPMSLDAIQSAIPHRDPFLLVDEVLQQDGIRIVCRKTFRGDEFWFRGHYPEFPLTPGVLLCEAAMQAGAILLAPLVAGRDGVPVVARMNDVRFKRMVVPGETIMMEVVLDERVSKAFFLSARVTVEGELAVRFQFSTTMAPFDAKYRQASAAPNSAGTCTSSKEE
jgi:3-hydroxyacyl-[acyl-carrier-protein] dehydratase